MTLWQRLDGPLKVGISFALFGIILTVVGIFRDPTTPVTAWSLSMGSLISGGSLGMVSRFSASQFWDQAQAAGATWFSVVPTIISHLLHASSEPSDVCKAQLRFGRSASSALAVETQAAFEKRFDVPIIETMGLTETAAQILSNPLPPATRKALTLQFARAAASRLHRFNLHEAT